MRVAVLLGLGTLALALSLALGGLAPAARLAMTAGAPGAAAALFADPAWRGAALMRAGRHAAAAEAFAAAGDRYGEGLALARTGRYAAALEALDLARAGGDRDAAAAFDLVAAFYAGLELAPDAVVSWANTSKDGPTVAASVGKGSGRATSTGDEARNAGASIDLPEVASRGRLGVRRVFDDRFMAATPRWLATLDDVPGAYLGARIAFEHKARQKAGLSPPPPKDPE
ncbi:hypothetical protein [Palleronia rufa]|uniref:hypothetical protein n=1 Tax=Palleronia rufa TaxID=1530186 RepID=UPI00056B4B1E|nr:hypothetical protein [Palleronia rufa]